MAGRMQMGNGGVMHVRFRGRSFDVPLRELQVGVQASDQHIRVALARYLDLNERELDQYAVERHETGNWTVRPEAVFG